MAKKDAAFVEIPDEAIIDKIVILRNKN